MNDAQKAKGEKRDFDPQKKEWKNKEETQRDEMVCVCVCVSAFARRKMETETESEGEEAGGGVLPEGECWNTEHAVLI